MSSAAPQNPLHERYASREMAGLFSAANRFRTWRSLWIALAESQRDLGLDITEAQLRALRNAADSVDLDRVAEVERQTRHDVVAHIRHYAEQADQIHPSAGGILHLGATSAFITDNTDVVLTRDALRLLRSRLVSSMRHLADFARRTKGVPCLAFTHFQPAQLTTVGKRATLWLQDFFLDLGEIDHRLATLRCRGAKGTTGTQASYLTLFGGNGDKVRELDRAIARRLGFESSMDLTGQTYSRKQDSQVLAALSGIAESCHKMGTDLRLLQGVGELSEPFDDKQVGSSAMAYKRNPIRSERLCGLSRKLMVDALNGPLNHATQWLERSLDDSSNRRLVLPDAFLTADAILGLAAHIAAGLRVKDRAIAARVERELPFMATETILMEAVLRGGDRQHLHERIRGHSLAAQEDLEAGAAENPLIESIVRDPDFRLSREEVEPWLDPGGFTGRSEQQVDEFLSEVIEPALEGADEADVSAPRI
ncbi:MAG: adenylosuccinate lyase [Thermoanaerobaculia bacterium]|nr:adenylosuccinate lyase [Thermoanaerobaculia bacterium]